MGVATEVWVGWIMGGVGAPRDVKSGVEGERGLVRLEWLEGIVGLRETIGYGVVLHRWWEI